MKKHWNKPYKRVERIGSLVVNNQWLGLYDDQTTGIVIEQNRTPEGITQIKPMRTSNINLLAGLNTVAVFRITSRKQNNEGLSGTDISDDFSKQKPLALF